VAALYYGHSHVAANPYRNMRVYKLQIIGENIKQTLRTCLSTFSGFVL